MGRFRVRFRAPRIQVGRIIRRAVARTAPQLISSLVGGFPSLVAKAAGFILSRPVGGLPVEEVGLPEPVIPVPRPVPIVGDPVGQDIEAARGLPEPLDLEDLEEEELEEMIALAEEEE